MNCRIPLFCFFLIGAALLLSGIGLWFTAIASAAPIPFSSEPEHARLSRRGAGPIPGQSVCRL